MATIQDGTIHPTNATDAEFRAWAQFIHDTFNLAWVQTSDTGQINLTTVTAPGAPNTSQGYEIWRMNDSLQGTFPIFVKVEYGSGAAALTPAIFLTIGKGSDGSGTITTIRFARTRLSSGTNNVAAHSYFGSAATNRLSGCFGTGTTCRALVLGIERTKDSSGNDTTEGLLLISNIDNQLLHRQWFVRMNEISQPDFEIPAYIRSLNGAFDSNVGMGVVIPIAGIARQPGMNFFVARSGDFSQTGAPTIDIYGQTIQLQGLDAMQATLYSGTGDVSSRVFMRFE